MSAMVKLRSPGVQPVGRHYPNSGRGLAPLGCYTAKNLEIDQVRIPPAGADGVKVTLLSRGSGGNMQRGFCFFGAGDVHLAVATPGYHSPTFNQCDGSLTQPASKLPRLAPKCAFVFRRALNDRVIPFLGTVCTGACLMSHFGQKLP